MQTVAESGSTDSWSWQKQAPLYLLYLGLLLITFLTQAPITYEQGLGWDGVTYGQVARQIHAGEPIVADAPFCHRLGTPWLASYLLDYMPLTRAFLLVNLLPILLFPFLFIRFWRRYEMASGAAWIFILIFVLSWHVSPRFNFYYPVTPDPWLWLFVLLTLPELSRPRQGWLRYPLLIFVGVLFRELVLWIALAGAVGRALSIVPVRWRVDRELRRHLIALLVGIAALMLTHLMATGTGEYGLLRAVIGGFWHKPFPIWVNGWFAAFGILLITALSSWNWLRGWVKCYPQETVWMIGLWILGWCAGTDTVRIVFWSMPVAFLMLYHHYRQYSGFYRRWWVLGLILVVHVLSQRWGTPIPDHDPAAVSQFPLFAPQGVHCPYLDLEPQYAPHWVSKISLMQYLAASFALVVGFWRWNRKQGEVGSK